MTAPTSASATKDEWKINVPEGTIVHGPTGLSLQAIPMATAEDYRRIEVLQEGRYRVIGHFRVNAEHCDLRQNAIAPGDANPRGAFVWAILADLDDYDRVGGVYAMKTDPITGRAQLEALCRTAGKAWISRVEAERAREDGGRAK